MTKAEKVQLFPLIASSTLLIRSFGKRIVLLVVRGMDGILNLDIRIPRNTIVLLSIIIYSRQKVSIAFAMQMVYNINNIVLGEKMDSISCKNTYCAYYEELKCKLTSFSLNVLGMCEAMLLVNIDENFLAAERKRLLAGLDGEWRS